MNKKTPSLAQAKPQPQQRQWEWNAKNWVRRDTPCLRVSPAPRLQQAALKVLVKAPVPCLHEAYCSITDFFDFVHSAFRIVTDLTLVLDTFRCGKYSKLASQTIASQLHRFAPA